MVIDFYSIFGENSPEHFKTILYQMMRNELTICASAASTEEDKKIYNELTHSLIAEINFGVEAINAKAEIDMTKLSNEFLSKNRGLIDLVNNNFNKKVAFFIESEMYSMIELSDIQQRVVESVQPEIIEELSTLLGGVS